MASPPQALPSGVFSAVNANAPFGLNVPVADASSLNELRHVVERFDSVAKTLTTLLSMNPFVFSLQSALSSVSFLFFYPNDVHGCLLLLFVADQTQS